MNCPICKVSMAEMSQKSTEATFQQMYWWRGIMDKTRELSHYCFGCICMYVPVRDMWYWGRKGERVAVVMQNDQFIRHCKLKALW